MHAWPSAHTGPSPQPHAPARWQLSALTGEQNRHAWPPTPQVFTVCAWQVLAEQHPSGQMVALHRVHTPPVHTSPSTHPSQIRPATPHIWLVVPGSQVLPLQQPWHDHWLHTHSPPTHACPSAHAGPLPQTQSPSLLHASALTGLHCWHCSPPAPQATMEDSVHTRLSQHPVQRSVSHMQLPARHVLSMPHGGPLPHRHNPSVLQPSALMGLHPTHTLPFTPQASTERSWHSLPLQQPAHVGG